MIQLFFSFLFNTCANKVWTEQFQQQLQKNINKERRLIITQAGNETGSIPNVLLIFKSAINMEHIMTI